MRKFKFGITYWLAALLVVFVAGCGEETVVVPSVVSTVPVNGATNVSVNTPISATFSMAMNPATLTSATFTVAGPDGAVAGAVAYSGDTATFTPSAPLAYTTRYTATITTGATNLGGTPILANYVWTFTTILPAPAVVSTIPKNGAVNVPIDQVISATFNEVVNSATITGSTFTVTAPDGAVAGKLAYSGVTATFTPTAVLAYSTVYTATITTGVMDVPGTPLATNYVWTFTTITPPPMVISTVPMNAATGVPIAQILSATFNDELHDACIACDHVYGHRPRSHSRVRDSKLRGRHSNLYADGRSCIQHRLHGHRHNRREGSGRHAAGRELRLAVQNASSSYPANGDLDGADQRGDGCAD
jgi:hypothetical protein